MKGKRRRHDPEFKARVAREALKGAKTIQQIAKEFDIHPVQARQKPRISSANEPTPRQHRPAGRRTGLAEKKVQTTRSVRDRIALVDKNNPKISMRKQSMVVNASSIFI